MALTRQNKVRRGPVTDLTDLRVGLYCRVSLDLDDTGKSTRDQEEVGRAWAASVGATVTDAYVEDGSRSASRYATKEREEYNRLVGDIKAGKLDVVWFWELSRQQRKLDVFASLRDLCREMGVLWAIGTKVYDPSDYKDMLVPGILSIMAENESEQTAERVRRGKSSSARAGRRAGKLPYGYRAVFDRDGRYLRDEPDQYDEQGNPTKDSPAAIVREIYSRLLTGSSLRRIQLDLNDRGIRTKQGSKWSVTTIRQIATNPSYIGYRTVGVVGLSATERVKAILDDVETAWPAIVDPESWWAVHRLLSDSRRKTFRPGRANHLLSSIVKCGECGAGLQRITRKGTVHYACSDRACTGIVQTALDDYVEETLVQWLSDPNTVTDLTDYDDSTISGEARADAEQLRAELAQLYRDVESGRVSAVVATSTEKGLLARIDEAEQRIQASTLPPVLRGNLGAQAQKGWDAMNIEAKRLLIQSVADIRVHRVGQAGRRGVPVGARVSWRWLIGSAAGQDPVDPAEMVRAHREEREAFYAAKADQVRRLRDAGKTYREIGLELGIPLGTAKSILWKYDHR